MWNVRLDASAVKVHDCGSQLFQKPLPTLEDVNVGGVVNVLVSVEAPMMATVDESLAKYSED